MSKQRKSLRSIPDGSLRITRGDGAAHGDPLSVAWKYENEWGQTVWLRPAGGIGTQPAPDAPRSG